MEAIRKIPVKIVHKEGRRGKHGVMEIANGSMEIASPKVCILSYNYSYNINC